MSKDVERVETPFDKYRSHYHASMFAAEFRRDHQGASDADMLLAYGEDFWTDLLAFGKGTGTVPAHTPSGQPKA